MPDTGLGALAGLMEQGTDVLYKNSPLQQARTRAEIQQSLGQSGYLEAEKGRAEAETQEIQRRSALMAGAPSPVSGGNQPIGAAATGTSGGQTTGSNRPLDPLRIQVADLKQKINYFNNSGMPEVGKEYESQLKDLYSSEVDKYKEIYKANPKAGVAWWNDSILGDNGQMALPEGTTGPQYHNGVYIGPLPNGEYKFEKAPKPPEMDATQRLAKGVIEENKRKLGLTGDAAKASDTEIAQWLKYNKQDERIDSPQREAQIKRERPEKAAAAPKITANVGVNSRSGKNEFLMTDGSFSGVEAGAKPTERGSRRNPRAEIQEGADLKPKTRGQSLTDKTVIGKYLDKAGNDPAKARKLAIDDGWIIPKAQ